jgi:hypothetical protein
MRTDAAITVVSQLPIQPSGFPARRRITCTGYAKSNAGIDNTQVKRSTATPLTTAAIRAIQPSMPVVATPPTCARGRHAVNHVFLAPWAKRR